MPRFQSVILSLNPSHTSWPRILLEKSRPGMLASVVTGRYCLVHQLLFIRSLQECLAFSPTHIAHAFGDAMQVVEAPCPRCLARPQTAMTRQCLALSAPSS